MIAEVKAKIAYPKTVDVYLGFEIIQQSDAAFVAIPRGWSPVEVTFLQAGDLPAIRKRIWSWWHRLVD